VVSQRILGITPGPGQPADLEHFLYPTAKEPHALATEVSGVSVTGCAEPQEAHAFDVQFTTDIPAGGKLRHAIGGNGEHPRTFRVFEGVRRTSRY